MTEMIQLNDVLKKHFVLNLKCVSSVLFHSYGNEKAEFKFFDQNMLDLSFI